MLVRWWWWFNWSFVRFRVCLSLPPGPSSLGWAESRMVWHSDSSWSRLSWKLAVKTTIIVVVVVVATLVNLVFYHATLCISAVFAFAQYLSVHLSDTFMYCIQTAEDVIELLSLPGSPIIRVFRPRVPAPNSKGNPVSGAQNARMVGKICDFRLKTRYLGNATS